jgi:PKD repeat protein
LPSKWQYPRYGEAWSECQWCGQEYPASLIWLNPRYGWQCYKCWDGLVQRDQILQPIFPYEGTRRTPAPVIPRLEGVGASLEPTYDYFLRDRITGIVYEVHLPPFSIVEGGIIVYFTTTLPTLTVSDETDNVWDGLRGITNGWDLYVRNGAIATELNPIALNLEIVDGICDFGTITSLCSVYMQDQATADVYLADFSTTPPTLTLSGSPGTTFDAVQAGDGWFIVVSGAALFSAVSPPADAVVFSNDCIVGGTPIDSGGTGPGITPTPDPPTVTCPSTVITDLDVAFTAVVTLPAGVTAVDYLWDYGDGTTEDTGTTPTASHSYASIGIYTVNVTLTDNFGRQVSAGGCPLTLEGEPVVVVCPDAVISDLDVDFTATPPAGVVTNYHWNFGDGNTADTGTTATTSHTYATAGTYDVVLTVTTTTGSGASPDCPVTTTAPTCNVAPLLSDDTCWNADGSGHGVTFDRLSIPPTVTIDNMDGLADTASFEACSASRSGGLIADFGSHVQELDTDHVGALTSTNIQLLSAATQGGAGGAIDGFSVYLQDPGGSGDRMSTYFVHSDQSGGEWMSLRLGAKPGRIIKYSCPYLCLRLPTTPPVVSGGGCFFPSTMHPGDESHVVCTDLDETGCTIPS